MRWLGVFNVLYGGLGLASAIYIGRPEAIGICAWVMALGVLAWCGVLTRVRRSIRRRIAAIGAAKGN